MEARGEIRGGRFVEGFLGEQFALPEALAALRLARRTSANDSSRALDVSAADPMNLVGIVTHGERVSVLSGQRVEVLADRVQELGIRDQSPVSGVP
jgi:ATP-dependent Lhr-like helicase